MVEWSLPPNFAPISRESKVVGHCDVVDLRLFLHDGDLGLNVGGLDVGDQPPFEPGAEPLLQSWDVLRELVRGDHDVFVGFVQE